MPNIPLEATPVQAGNMLDELNKLRNQINALAAQIGGGGTGGITGTLTSGIIPVASGATSVADGSLSDDGANNIGGQNGVDLTIGAGTVTTVGTVGSSYGPHLNLNGGESAGGYYGYGGNLYLRGGAATGAVYNYGGNVRIIGGSAASIGGVSLYGYNIGIGAVHNASMYITGATQFVSVGAASGVALHGTSIDLQSAVVNAGSLPGTAGVSGSLYVDSGAGNVVKRVP